MLHIGAATLNTDYSPGMVTALFIFIPLFIKATLNASEKMIPFVPIFLITVAGVILHFILIAGVNLL